MYEQGMDMNRQIVGTGLGLFFSAIEYYDGAEQVQACSYKTKYDLINNGLYWSIIKISINIRSGQGLI